MSTPTKPLLPSSETELETPDQSPSITSTWRSKPGHYPEPSSTRQALRDAWLDILSIWDQPQLHVLPQVARELLAIVWNLALVGLLIFLGLLSRGYIDGENPCQPDGEFRFDGNGKSSAFNWWAAEGFFQITLGWGRWEFAGAKLVDVTWDLVVGRGGQAVMTLVSWRVFSEYLRVSLAAKPASYTTVWIIRIQKDNSALSTLSLASKFFKRELASKSAMCFIIWTALFILAFPTFASSMTGYTPYNKAYVNGTDGRLIQFSDISPIAYIIHDGDRLDGYDRDFPVPWRSGSRGASLASSMNIYDVCTDWRHDEYEEGCEIQGNVSDYIQQYGFNNGTSPDRNRKESTSLFGQTLGLPPLNISSMFLPDVPFYWNWSMNYTTNFVSAEIRNANPYGNISRLTFLVDNAFYSSAKITTKGICQPIKDGDSIEYQWGFSFLQLFVVTVLLQLWSLGLLILWINASQTLRRNNYEAFSQGWKGLLEFTGMIRAELETANINPGELLDKELDDKIQKLLQGGSMSSDPFSEGTFSVWQWMWERKGLALKAKVLKVVLFITLIILENTLRPVGLYYHFDKVRFGIVVSFYVMACLVVAMSLAATPERKVYMPVITVIFCFPFLLYDARDRNLALPGFCVGSFLAASIGSTRGSRAVLFLVPVLCNYFPVLAYFVCTVKQRQDVVY